MPLAVMKAQSHGKLFQRRIAAALFEGVVREFVIPGVAHADIIGMGLLCLHLWFHQDLIIGALGILGREADFRPWFGMLR